MSDPTTVGPTSNRELLQQRREERVDHVDDRRCWVELEDRFSDSGGEFDERR